MRRYTSDDGVFLVWEAISMLEQITSQWWEHSASENLYVRKLHYTLKRTAGYSFWPIGGWVKLWEEMAAAFTALGGELLQPAAVKRVLVENRVVAGLELSDGEVIEARDVVVSVPVWNLPRLFDDGVLPWDLLERIQLLRKNRNRACWLGYWIAAKEPVIAMTEREMASFFATPRTGLPGFTLNFTGYDPGISPPGEYLTCVGAAFDAVEHFGDRGLDRTEVPRALARHRGDAPAGEARPLEEAAPRDDLRRDQQAGARRGDRPGCDRARRRGALARRRHDALARRRHRQGGADGNHRGGDGARAAGCRSSPTRCATSCTPRRIHVSAPVPLVRGIAAVVLRRREVRQLVPARPERRLVHLLRHPLHRHPAARDAPLAVAPLEAVDEPADPLDREPRPGRL